MCIRSDRVRFFSSGLTAGERKYFGQASVATNLPILHLDATSICCMEHSNLARTQLREFADWYANMAVENNLDREGGSPSKMMAVLAQRDNRITRIKPLRARHAGRRRRRFGNID